MSNETGSSPPARGALSPAHPVGALPGIIPACAGSTGRSVSIGVRPGDHPRLRGEHYDRRDRCHRLAGSSPPARGARNGADRERLPAGIIPACAGSTHTIRRRSSPHGDHPRLRGEHLPLTTVLRSPLGSSPPARGAPGEPEDDDEMGGIIPACAGSTQRHRSPRSTPRDHPRLRGEHSLFVDRSKVMPGSSPPARGAPPRPLSPGGTHGIIPACAGST